MLYIYKRSSTPIVPWEALRHGGVNNLNASIRGRFLLMTNFDVVQREGAWHYIFEFEARETLEMSALAQFLGEAKKYPDDMNWRDWMGSGCQVISAKVRENILNLPPDQTSGSAVITDVRESTATRPSGAPLPENLYQPEIPEEFILSGEMG
jgi:hypothetical protein